MQSNPFAGNRNLRNSEFNTIKKISLHQTRTESLRNVEIQSIRRPRSIVICLTHDSIFSSSINPKRTIQSIDNVSRLFFYALYALFKIFKNPAPTRNGFFFWVNNSMSEEIWGFHRVPDRVLRATGYGEFKPTIFPRVKSFRMEKRRL